MLSLCPADLSRSVLATESARLLSLADQTGTGTSSSGVISGSFFLYAAALERVRAAGAAMAEEDLAAVEAAVGAIREILGAKEEELLYER